jgi:hypothetical protein
MRTLANRAMRHWPAPTNLHLVIPAQARSRLAEGAEIMDP